MTTMTTFLSSPLRNEDGSVVLKKFNGQPRTQRDRILYHLLGVVALVLAVGGSHLLLTMNQTDFHQTTIVRKHQVQPTHAPHTVNA